jgi:ABC-type phosphate transport system auxiliary subunit
MGDVHMVLGIAVLATNLVAGAWGLFAWLTRRPSVAFWYLLRIAQIAIVLQTVLGVALLLSGRKAGSDLHYLYGLLPLPLMLMTEMMRVGAAQHVVGDIDYAKIPDQEARQLAMKIFIAETRVMALGCLIIAALSLRAATTSGGLF